MSLVGFFDKLNKNSLYLILFLIPLFFLPFTINILDFPKQILASFLIILSFLGWLIKGIFSEKIVLRGNKIIYIAFALFFLSLLASSIFSSFPRGSFLGISGENKDNFIVLFSLLILTFLFLNSFENEKDFLLSLFFWLLALALVGIFNFCQIKKIFILPYQFSKSANFNTVGGPYIFAILASVFLPVSLVLTFFSKKYLKIIFALISFILFLNIVLVNFRIAWFILIFSVIFLFVFGFSKEKRMKLTLAAFLMIVLIASLFFYFYKGPLPSYFPILEQETNISFFTESYILKGAFGQNFKNFILGTGPGTFLFNYLRYKPLEINQTSVWDKRFNSGSSLFFDWLLTKGLLGAFCLLFFCFLAFYFSFYRLIKERNKIYFDINLALLAGFFGLILISFIYSFNFSLFFVFWFLLGGIFFLSFSKTTEIKLSSPLRTIFANAILMLFIVLFLFLVFFQGQKYLAEYNYLKGVLSLRSGDIDKTIEYLNKAATLNTFEDLYRRELAYVYLRKSEAISKNSEISNEEKIELINSALANGRSALDRAILFNPNNVDNWNMRGYFYRSLIGVQGAENEALISYQKSSELEPISPIPYGEMGRIYILMAQFLRNKNQEDLAKENLNLAQKQLEKALELKPDYAIAHYLMAVVLDQLGNLDQAIAKLEQTQILLPEDIGLNFQLGLLYWRKEEIEKAKNKFEQALLLANKLNRDYSDARYMLALIYDKKGDREKAKEEIKKLIASYPENEQLKKILENLEKGLPALEGIASQQAAPQLPSETKKLQP